MLPRRAEVEEIDNPKWYWGHAATGNLICSWQGCRFVGFCVKQFAISLKLKIGIGSDLAITLPGIHLTGAHMYQQTCTTMFIEAPFITAPNWKQPKCWFIMEWINTSFSVYIQKLWQATSEMTLDDPCLLLLTSLGGEHLCPNAILSQETKSPFPWGRSVFLLERLSTDWMRPTYIMAALFLAPKQVLRQLRWDVCWHSLMKIKFTGGLGCISFLL